MQLEQLAEKTVALVREDAHDSAKRVAAALGSDAKPPRRAGRHASSTTSASSRSCSAASALMSVNLMAGGVLAIAGPAILAMFARGKIHEEYKKRAKELAPEVMRETAKKVGAEARRDDRRVREEARRVGRQRRRGAAPRGASRSCRRRRPRATRGSATRPRPPRRSRGRPPRSRRWRSASRSFAPSCGPRRTRCGSPPPKRRRSSDVSDVDGGPAMRQRPRRCLKPCGPRSRSFSKRFMKRRQSLTTRGPAALVRMA